MLLTMLLTRQNQFTVVVDAIAMLTLDATFDEGGDRWGIFEIPMNCNFGVNLVDVLTTRALTARKS